MQNRKKRNWLKLVSLMSGFLALGCGTYVASAALDTRSSTLTPTAESKTAHAPLVADCVGDACSQVTVTWDDTKQQYKAQNNSTDQWVRVNAENLAATATACVAAGQAEYLALKSIVSYRAEYDATCGNPAE